MSIADHMTRCPRPFDHDRGAEARAALPELDGPAADLVAGAAGSSPYLGGLIQREAAWIAPALDDPDAALAALLAGLEDTPPDTLDSGLREAKRRVALLVGLADLGGAWPLEKVTGGLSDFADTACRLALRAALAREIRRGKLPGQTEADLEHGAGMVIMAMGKMGAGELNYSSDIDLVALFDETRFDPDDFLEARPAFIRATRRMVGSLSDITGEGYVFRTDLRLRPDPSVTPVCLGMEAAERYYESQGRTWERAAWIKARPCAGDFEGGHRFLDTLRPFIWRRHLDFAAIQDAHDMRQKIKDHKGFHGEVRVEGHDMKLGAGGIRTIEFFAQFHQLIAGGRDPDLRLPGTVPALRLLAEKGWFPPDLATTLADHYRVEREVEHRIQMLHDAQTHEVPRSAEGFERLAALMDRDPDALRADLAQRLRDVERLTEDFLDRDDASTGASGAASGAARDHDPGFDTDLTLRWPSYPALRSTRAQQIFKRLKPEILARLGRTAKPEEALTAFDGFLAGLPAGVQVFALFEANPQLIDLLVDIVGTAPDLGLHLSRNAGVLDAVIDGGFFAEWPGAKALTEDLVTAMAQEDDYERQLDAVRRSAKEWHFRIGVHHLRGLIDGAEAGTQYADLADGVLAALFPVVTQEFARKHGSPPGRGAVVVGMGSLGAGRLNARSDLDLIVIYDADGVETSDGRRPLAARTYYARLTQALVTALSAPMAEGRLYETDMRLRPSGHQGPVATSLQAFRSYHSENAWIWEQLALTRARVVAATGPAPRPGAGTDTRDSAAGSGAVPGAVAGTASQSDGGSADGTDADAGHDASRARGDGGSAAVTALGAEVTSFRDALQERGRDAAEVLGAVAEMRARISQAKGTGQWELKVGPGRNQEIELLAQAGALIAGVPSGPLVTGLDGLVEEGLLTDGDRAALMTAYRLSWRIGQAAKLLTERPLEPDDLGEDGRAFLLREAGAADVEDLRDQLDRATAAAAQIIDRVLAPYARDAAE